MRSSGTLMNVAAAVAVALAVGSLWQAYKVRYASDDIVEQAAANDPMPVEVAPATPAPTAEPAPVAETVIRPADGAPQPKPAGAPTATEPPSAVAAPREPAAVVSPGITSAASREPPSAPVSLRDPRALSVPGARKEAAVAAKQGPAALAKAVDTSVPATAVFAPPAPGTGNLLDRRPLNPEVPPGATSDLPKADPAPRPAANSLRDVRPITQPHLLDPRSLANPHPDPAGGSTAAKPEKPVVVASLAPAAADGATCEQPAIATEPLDGGLMRVGIASVCRANQNVQFSYGGATLIRRFDAAGQLDFKLDCFAGATSLLLITFADGRRETRQVAARDLDKVSKIAVVWNAPVNLDLHAFEYSAAYGRAGHVWERAASTLVTARELALGGKRGRGLLSTSDDGRSLGDKLEVYTFFHNDEQAAGVVAMGLDYETRGESPSGTTCGAGSFAEVRYQVVLLDRRGQIARENGVFTGAPCGERIGPQVRFDPLLLPALRIQK